MVTVTTCNIKIWLILLSLGACFNKVGEEKYAIECEDGSMHSYSGSSEGLSTIGPALCEGHGGANPDNDVNPAQAGQMEVEPRLNGQDSSSEQNSAQSKNFNSSRSNNLLLIVINSSF